jgi:succinate-acetate transporter protein
MSPPSESSTDEYNEDDPEDLDLSRPPTQAGQPGNLHPHYQRVLMSKRNIANPSPLGLCGFALTTFLLSAINLGTMGVTHPNIVVAAAFAYGGLVQFCAGMWCVVLFPFLKFFSVFGDW